MAVLTKFNVKKLLAASLCLTALSGCWGLPGLTASGGVGPLPGLEPSPEEQAETDRRAAEQAARRAADEENRQIAMLRSTAVDALSNALSDLVHRCSAGSMTDSNGSTRVMARRVATLRDEMSSAPDSEVRSKYDEARTTLDAAYLEAVSCGAVSPAVYGQRNADETWWFISSP